MTEADENESIARSTITVTCWGCNRAETHPMKLYAEYAIQLEEMASRGWVRRAFGPKSDWDKGPWFCSLECAHESYNAKRAEAWWVAQADEVRHKEFQSYCQETDIPKVYFALFGIFIAIILSLYFRGF